MRRAAWIAIVVLNALALRAAAGQVSAWPAEPFDQAADLTFLNPVEWLGNLSGAYWNPVTRRLWLADNSGVFTVLKESADGGFEKERDYSVGGDLEAITQADPAADRVFLASERLNRIQEFAISTGALNQSWDLTALIGGMLDSNESAEGLAFIPDRWLAASGFRGGDGELYPRSVHGAGGFGGIMLVAVQDTQRATAGCVYAVDLKRDGSWTSAGCFKTSRPESCELTFDASIGRLYILHNSGGNFLEVTDLTSTPSGDLRQFTRLNEFEVPSASNIEGFAITPALTDDNTLGEGWCFLTDDLNQNGALRWFRQLPQVLEVKAGAGQVGAVASTLPIAPSVTVRDAFGNPLPGLAVQFSVASGGGSIAGSVSITNSDGVASAGTWTLGAQPGENTLVASSDGVGSLSFTATASAMIVRRVRVSLRFFKTSGDSLFVTGRLPLPAEFGRAGKTVDIQVGDLSRSYTLSALGVSEDRAFKLYSNPRGTAYFSFKLREADLFNVLQPVGFTQTGGKLTLPFPLAITVGGIPNAARPYVSYFVRLRDGTPRSGHARRTNGN